MLSGLAPRVICVGQTARESISPRLGRGNGYPDRLRSVCLTQYHAAECACRAGLFSPCGLMRSECSRRASDKEDHTDADRSVLLVHDCLRCVCLTQYHAAVRATRLSPVRSGGWAGADRWSAARRLTKYAAARPLFALRAGRMAASGITRRGALRRRRLLCARADGSLPKWWDPAGGNDFGGNPAGGGKLYSPCPTG